jgi:hypothetical protein
MSIILELIIKKKIILFILKIYKSIILVESSYLIKILNLRYSNVVNSRRYISEGI